MQRFSTVQIVLRQFYRDQKRSNERFATHKFPFVKMHTKIPVIQECIPVGCVPPAH